MKWFIVTSRGRNHALLMIDSVVWANLNNYAQKMFGFKYRVQYYRQFNGSRWISEKDRKALMKLFAEEMKKNPNFLYRISLNMKKTGQRIISLANTHKEKNWSSFPNKKLIKLLEEFYELMARLWAGPCFYGYYFFLNDIYLEQFKKRLEKKLTKNNFEKIWNYLITAEKTTLTGQERVALLKLAKRHIKSKKVPKKAINEHLRKFAFINKYIFWGRGYTFNEIDERLNDFINKGKKYIDQELNSFKKPILSLNRFSLTENEKLIIRGFRKIAYSLNFADEAVNYFTYHLKSFFDEMAKRLGISYKELVSMRFQEIKDSLLRGVLVVCRKELKERFKDHALIFTRDKVCILTGKELKNYRKLELVKKNLRKVKELKGIAVFGEGLIKGRVKIIDDNKKVKNFKKGNILVTQMTNPSYLSAMQKASAFITDEGGLLCHAAIVSRELNIPCIIGTKIATKVLKDGDLVEVDANNGVVRVIKKK